MPKLGPQPHLWVTGPDPERHARYLKYLQQKNQASWRGETWSLTFDQWLALWGDRWERRGRQRGDYCMSRIDWAGPWDQHNAVVITREEHARHQLDARMGGIRLFRHERTQDEV